MDRFVRTYHNSLPHQVCDQLIQIYEKTKDIHNRYDQNGYPNMDQFDFTSNRNINLNLHKYLVDHALAALDQYKKDVPESKFWPDKFNFESFRVKHYSAGGKDRFDEHVDVKTLDSARRFLIFFWYLNDVEEGGETEITSIGLKVKPEKGKLLIFPPFWMFPHIGYPVIKGEKFLLSSYMHLNEKSM